jgi:hypothetical protein
MKLYAVILAIGAYARGYENGYIIAYTRSGSTTSPDKIIAGMHRTLPTFSHTFGFYVSAVDDFYNIHPTAIQAPVEAVIGCLQDKPYISCDEVAQGHWSS